MKVEWRFEFETSLIDQPPTSMQAYGLWSHIEQKSCISNWEKVLGFREGGVVARATGVLDLPESTNRLALQVVQLRQLIDG
jgi:hypothetical protein